MKNIVFFCGAHTCGKTTILKHLEEKKLIDFNGYEIGKKLFYERKLITSKQDYNFEIEVTNLELQRDFKIFNRNEISIGIESWHVGNLAYAATRNPKVLDELIEKINTSPFINNAHGIWLRVSKANILKRTKTFKDNASWAADFYSKIDKQIENCFNLLDINKITVINADNPLPEVIAEIEERIIINN